MAKPIDYVLCAAGSGQRFKDVGLEIPKALIKINGKTLLERSLYSIDFHANDRLIIITQAKDHVKSNLKKNLEDTYPKLDIIWIEIKSHTSGQLATFFLAKNFLRPKLASVVIFN